MKIKQVHIDNAKFFTLLDLNSLHVGDELVYNIFIQRNKDYVIIIEAGTKLSDELYEKLQKQEQLYVSKMEMNRQKPSCDTLIAYIKYYKHNLEKSLHFLYEINDKLFTEFLDSKNNTINTSCLQTIVKSIIFLIQQNQNYLKETMPYFSSEYSIAYHSLHVAIYTINLSHLLRLQEEQLIDAGIAGLLHDLGLKKINNSILTKEQPLSFKELELVHKHSIYSTEFAQKNNISNQYILDAIMHHHECYDGTGYPDHLKKNKILQLTSILAIADVFDALTNDRPYRQKHTSFDALKIMMQDTDMVHKFNQTFLKEFLHSFLK